MRWSSLVDVLQIRAHEHAGKRVFTFLSPASTADTSLTYEELFQRAQVIAAAVQRHARAGDRVMLLLPPGLEFVTAFFGCLCAGAVAVPLPPPLRGGRSANTLHPAATAARPALILSTQAVKNDSGQLLTLAPELARVPWMTVEHAGHELHPTWHEPALDHSSLALLQYTSGSTSSPKGVLLSHGNLLHNSALICRCFANNAETKAVIWLPPHHDMGLIGGVIQPVYCGGSGTLLSPTTYAQRPALWLETITRTRATVSGGPDFAYDLCTRRITPDQRQELDLSSWEVAFCGAESIRAGTLERFCETFGPCGFRREAFLPCYGLAEATLIVSGGPRLTTPTVVALDPQALAEHRARIAEDSKPSDRLVVGCGELLDGQQIRIVDPEHRTTVNGNRIGEIWIQGPSVGLGYDGRTRDTAATFGALLSDAGEGPFLRTGDLGFVHGRQLFLTGRLKDLMIVRGRNYYPEDLEASVEGCHPALRPGHCTAFATNGPRGERVVVVAEIDPRHRATDTEAAIRAIRGAVAARHELTADVIVLAKAGTIPKTSSGKMRRAACRELFEADKLAGLAQWTAPIDDRTTDVSDCSRAPASTASAAGEQSISGWLRAAIARRLGVAGDQVEPETPFADLGLGSAEAVEIASELEHHLGRKVPATAMYAHPTVARLSAWLARGTSPLEGSCRTEVESRSF